MRIIPTKIHGVIDYMMGLLLIASPWVFGFARGGIETIVPVALGFSALLYSIFTDYEMGLIRTLSMRTHLALDLGSGLLMAASPWLFGFSEIVSTPFVVLGLLEIGASLMTKQTPRHERQHGTRHAH